MISHDISWYIIMILCISANFQLSGVLTPSALFCAFFTIASFHINSFSERKNHRSEKLWMVCQRFTPVLWWYTVREPKGIDNDTYLQNCNGGSISQNHCPIYYVCTWYRIEGFKQISIKRESQEGCVWNLISCTISTMSKTNHIPSITIHP